VAKRQYWLPGGGFLGLATPAISGGALCLTTPAPGYAGALIAAGCAPAGAPAPPVQAFAFDAASGLISATGFAPSVADAGAAAPFYRGAPTQLSAAASAASTFALNTTGAPVAGAGRLVCTRQAACASTPAACQPRTVVSRATCAGYLSATRRCRRRTAWPTSSRASPWPRRSA